MPFSSAPHSPTFDYNKTSRVLALAALRAAEREGHRREHFHFRTGARAIRVQLEARK